MFQVDTCSEGYCNNGGTCLAIPGGGGFGGYLCDCLSGFSGMRCESVSLILLNPASSKESALA